MAHLLDIQYYNTFILKGKNDSNEIEFHVEESRIKGGFNDASVDLGVRAHATADFSGKEERPNALIHSGIFNSKTGVNNINQFSIGQNITKALDSQDGSIQKLFAEDTNLNVFQEEKVSWIAIDKDIIYTAEGSPQVTSANQVFGQVVSYNGNYGIGKNPESFAYYAGRKYFVDKPKGAVLRLSRDGITEISNYGMRSFFLEELKDQYIKSIQGSWDIEKRKYIVSYQKELNSELIGPTVAFDETANGWISFYDFYPKFAGSIDGSYYSFHNGVLYKHHDSSSSSFYGNNIEASVTIVMNANPSANKVFHTLNYEGTQGWEVENITTDTDLAENISPVVLQGYITDDNLSFEFSKFRLQDGKYASNLINKSPARYGEVVSGGDISGLKGFYAKLTIKTSDTDYRELFSVSANYNINSY